MAQRTGIKIRLSSYLAWSRFLLYFFALDSFNHTNLFPSFTFLLSSFISIHFISFHFILQRLAYLSSPFTFQPTPKKKKKPTPRVHTSLKLQMDPQVETHGTISNDPQPLDLAHLSSTGGPQPNNGVDYSNGKITVISTTERDQPHLQPGVDQKQRRQDTPVSTQTTTPTGGFGRKFKMAGLVDRVRLAQLEERPHQPHDDPPQGEKHHRLNLFPSRDKNTQDPETHRGKRKKRPVDTQMREDRMKIPWREPWSC